MSTAFYLSGGGVPAIESIGGMMESLKDNFNISPDYIVSNSGGGIPAHLINHGVRIGDFVRSVKTNSIIKKNNIFKVLAGSELYDNSKLRLLLEELTGYKFNDNHYVNVTDIKTRKTYYVKANSNTVLASMSIPEVFPSVLVSAEGRSYEIDPDSTHPRRLIEHKVELSSIECVDGGIYDSSPTPLGDEYDKFDKIFILLCSSNPTEDITEYSRVKRILEWLTSTMDREYNQVLRDYSNDPKVTILKPDPIKAPLLDWSDNYCCYENAYNYVKNLIL